MTLLNGDTRDTKQSLPADKSAEVTLTFEDNRLASLVFGHYDQNIARIERRLNVSANANGNHVVIKGAPDTVPRAQKVFEILYERVKQGQSATAGDVDGIIEEGVLQGSLFPKETEAKALSFDHISTRKRGLVRARNQAHDYYLRALKKHEMVFAA